MLRSHAIICVDRNGNESRREIPAKDWKDCFQRALSAEGSWRNFVRFQAVDDPFNRVDRPGAPPPPALGKLGEAIEAAQVKAEKQNGQQAKAAKSFDTAPEIRIGRGELAAIFARMLPQMPETFTRIELEKRAFDSTGERYDISDCHNAVQYLGEKGLIQRIARGRYKIPEDVRQGKRTLTAQIRSKNSSAAQPVARESAEQPTQITTDQQVTAQKPTSFEPTTPVAAASETTATQSAAPTAPKDVYTAIAGFASALVLPDAEEAERELTQILEVVTRFEAYVRRHLQAAKLRKELLAMIS